MDNEVMNIALVILAGCAIVALVLDIARFKGYGR
jgi:hypothetical protein